MVRGFFSLSETTDLGFFFTLLRTSDCKATGAGHFPAEAAQPFPSSLPVIPCWVFIVLEPCT